MIAFKKIIRRCDIADIAVPEDFGEIVEIIVLPVEKEFISQEDKNCFEWDSESLVEKKAFSDLTASSIREWKNEDEDEIWQ